MRIQQKILFFSTGLFLLLTFSSKAQQQYYFDHGETMLRNGLELMQNEQFGAAKIIFEQLMGEIPDKSSLQYSNASYYAIVCAVELNEKNAADLVRQFASEHRSSSWMPRVWFLEGRVNFEQKRYNEALLSFNKVDYQQLSANEQIELDYKSAFCLLRQNKADEALQRFAKIKDTKSPYQSAANYYYAHIQYVNGNNEQALTHFQRIRNEVQYRKTVPIYELHIQHRTGNFAAVTQHGEEVLQLSDNRRRPEITRMIADAWYKQGDYIKALSYYAVFENQNRRQLSRQDQYQIGIARFKTGNFREAISNFQAVAETADELGQSASYHLAHCYLKTDQKLFARNAFMQAHKNNHDKQITEDALFNYARLSLETGADPFNEAIGLLERFLETNAANPRAAEARQLIVQLYLKSKDYDAALASLERNRSRNPELQAIYDQLSFNLAVEMFNQSNFTKAAEYFSRIQTSSQGALRAKAIFWLAETRYQQKNYVDAQRLYRQFLGLREAAQTDLVPQASYNLGYAHFQLKQYPQALAAFRQYIAKPSSKEPRMLHDAWLRIGDAHFIGREYDKAIEAYTRVIDARHADADYALLQKGLAQGALSRHNLKINTLDQLIKNHPRSTYYDQALYEMAATSIITNDYRSAIAYFDKLVKERPRSPFAREAMLKTGLIYFNNNQNQQAITQLKKVAETYPGTPDAREALNTLRVIYMEMNNLDEYFAFTRKAGFGEVSISEQDSLSFAMAENFYTEGKNNEALQALNAYLKNNPKGAYTITALYYKMMLELRSNQLDEALKSADKLLEIKNNPYYEQALLAAARIHYDRQNYTRAYSLYSELYTLSTTPSEKTEALEGRMKSSFFTGKHEEAIESSRLLRNSDNIKNEQLMQAHYIAGKSYFELRRLSEAREELIRTHRMNSGALGAEAYYLIARISFENNQLNDAENQIFDLAEKYANHDFWVAKSFILLADIYVKQNNIFQARETLKSIVDNYKGEDLRQEAARKLNMLK